MILPEIPFERRQELLRSVFARKAAFSPDIDAQVREILEEVRTGGDRALLALTRRFDGVDLKELQVSPAVLEASLEALPPDLMEVFSLAIRRIRAFHERQRPSSWFMEEPGALMGQRVVPMERVGLYVPGGKAAYPSTVFMNAIPAQVAGVQEMYLVSPPQSNGLPHPLILAAAAMLGIDRVFAVGGAQAIAALAFGTETIPKVDKIVGPGNAYVAAAKRMVFGEVDIDAIAGPSEVVVLADATAEPEAVTADLFAQAEHDERASAILVTPHRPLIEAVRTLAEAWLEEAPRKEILARSLSRFSACILTPSMEEALTVVNELAPEHLELMVRDPWGLLPEIRHAGAIFLGPHTPEAAGDYLAGPNHVLPTAGTARYASALGVEDFIRRQSILALRRDKLQELAPAIMRFAEAEELPAHARSVAVRLENPDASREVQ